MTKEEIRAEFKKILYEASDKMTDRLWGNKKGKYLVLSLDELNRISMLLSKACDIVPIKTSDDQSEVKN